MEHINLLDPLDVPARLDELRELKDGWLDGEGLAPNSEALDWLATSFDCRYPDDLPLPHVYPTLEGGVLAEWSSPPNEVSLDVNLATRQGEWHSLDVNTDAENARTLNLADNSGWTWIAEKIRSIFEVQR